MIRIHDMVLYGAHGVCEVEDTTVKKVGDREIHYFILKPVYDRSSTVYVPADNEELIGKIRRILSAEEIYEIIRTMPDEDLLWIENETERRKAFNDILSSGDRNQLIRLIKTLYFRQQERKEHKKNLLMSDEKLMKDAERILYEEFTYVLHIERDQVLPFITEQIEAGKSQ